MASKSKVAILIGSAFDAKGFKKAETATEKLSNSAMKLGKTLGLALSTAAIVSFGKAAANAFAEDEKSAALLANAMKNLGKAFEIPAMEKFISNMELAVGIADDELRPAMQSLLTTFENTADAQSMLALATEVSRGSGQSLATVIADLTKASTGQTKGLEKYKLGLTAAELKTMTFTEIMEKFNNQFKGSNAAFLDTYAGKLTVLKVAASTAQEIIGKGLVDAIMAITGSIDVESLSTKIISLAQNLANAFVAIGNIIGENIALVKMLGAAIIGVFTATKVYAGMVVFIGFVKKLIEVYKVLRTVSIGAAIAAMAAVNPLAALVGGGALVLSIIAATKLLDKLTAKSESLKPIKIPSFTGLTDPKYKKIQADQIKAAKINLKLAKDQAAIKRAGSIFDMTQIQIIAALKGQISKEERDRLELQLALITGNADEVVRLTGEIGRAQGLTEKLIAYLQTLPDADNPFKAWKGYLDDIELQAKRIAELKLQAGIVGETVNTNISAYIPSGASPITYASSGIGTTTAEQAAQLYGGMGPAIGQQQPIFNVYIDGQQFTGTVTGGLQNQSLSGQQAFINRIYGQFGG